MPSAANFTLEELGALGNAAKSGDLQAKRKYFWALQKSVKPLIASGLTDKAVKCVHEMTMYQDSGELGQKQLGWSIFNVLKVIVNDEKQKNQFGDSIPHFIKTYAALNIVRTEEVHSYMLWAAYKLREDGNSWYLDLMKKSSLIAFRPKDYEDGEFKGKKFASQAEMAVIHCAKLAEQNRNESDIKWILSKIDDLIPKKPNSIWLTWHKGKLLMQQGMSAEARALVKQVLMIKKAEYSFGYYDRKTPDLDELHTDGGFGSSDNDKKCSALEITHIQTAIRGKKAAIEITIEHTDIDCYQVSCPHQKVAATKGRKKFKAAFDQSFCATCPLSPRCNLITDKSGNQHRYYFDEEDYQRKKRAHNIYSIPIERWSLRANVEATVSEFKRKMPGDKLKVRGQFKTMLFAIATGIGINFGRIVRYLTDLGPEENRIACGHRGKTGKIMAIYGQDVKERKNDDVKFYFEKYFVPE